jgi:glycosidase
MALLLVLRGTVFIYQGEELGLPQSAVPFELLQDPFGRPNWPVHKGRDGCRTPMPWQADHPTGGFTSGRPWLPSDAALLVLRRTQGDDTVLAAFNLGPAETQHHLNAVPPPRGEAIALHGATLQGARLRLPPGSALILALPAQPPHRLQEPLA